MKWRIVVSLLARPVVAALGGALVTAGVLSQPVADALLQAVDALSKLFVL